MARCGCTQACSCAAEGGLTPTAAVTVSGNGAAGTPYHVQADVVLVADNAAPLTGPNALKASAAGLYVQGGATLRKVVSNSGVTVIPAPSDIGALVLLTATDPVTVSLPLDTAGFPVGAEIQYARYGAGEVTFVGAEGATVNATPGKRLTAQYSVATAIHVAVNTWLLYGGLKV